MLKNIIAVIVGMTVLALANSPVLPTVQSCTDLDGDGYFAELGCGTLQDCDDNNPGVFPGNSEQCNSIDDNCNGQVDEPENLNPPLCSLQQGVCSGSVKQCTFLGWQPCDYLYIPDFENTEVTCDALDNDCDGQVDEEGVCSVITCPNGEYKKQGEIVCIPGTEILNPGTWLPICGSDRLIQGTEICDDTATPTDAPGLYLPLCVEGERLVQGTDECEVVPSLPGILMDSITYMYSEEGLAYDVYMNIYKIQAVNQLQKIAINSETKHIEEVNKLAIKYDLNITKYPNTDHPYSTDDLDRYGSGEYPVEPIQELYNLLYDKGIRSKRDALEVGCMVEVVDIDDLDHYISQAIDANALDVLDTFNFLRNGSYSHYWTFDNGLKNMGVTDGCCSLESALGYDFCHPEYPNNATGDM